MELLVGSAYGIYIPQYFVEYYEHLIVDRIKYYDDIEILKSGAEHEDYWESWIHIVDNATILLNGKEYYLYEYEDLWAIEVGKEPEFE